MTYPSLSRFLAAGLTALVLGVPLAYWLSRGELRMPPIENPVAAQGSEPGDWIMYGGTPSRNMVNLVAKGLPAEWDVDAKKGVKWVAALGSKAYGGPIVAGGRVFVGTNNMNPRDKKYAEIQKDGKPIDLGIVMSFDEAKGDFLWQAVHTKLPGGQVVDWPYEGICSSPYVDGDRLFYVSNRCEVVCADVKTGKAHWTYDMIGKLKVFPHNISDCSPLYLDGNLWVVTSNGVNEDHLNVPEPGAPSFIKLKVNKDSAELLWKENWPSKALLDAPKDAKVDEKDFFKQLVNKGQLIQHGQWANPAYAVVNGQPQIVFPGGDGWLYAVDPAGKLIWKFDCNPKEAKYALRTGERSDSIATPVIYKNRVYIGIGQDPEHGAGIGHFWCIDMTKKGDVSPDLVTDDTVHPPKTKKNPNSAAVWHYGGAITDPAERKKNQGRVFYFGRTMSTAAIHEGILYVSDLSGYLHCMDADSGKVHWVHDTRSEIWSSPYYADGKVYLGTDSGTVLVYEHGTKLKLLAENDMGARVRATPIAANGVLFVMTENKLYAIK